MTLRARSINSLSPIRPPIRAKLAVILASFRSANADGIVAALDHLLIALLHPVGPVVPAVLAPLRPCGLRETEERTDESSRDG